MDQHNPPHPGNVLSGLHLAGSGMTVTELASRVGVSRKTLSQLINGRQGMSADMAVRLEKVFPDTHARRWLQLQLEYDLYHARNRLTKV